MIPQIDICLEDGSYKEEWKMVQETKKILDKNIEVSATCVRVPVFACHSESLNIEFENPISPDKAREILSDADGVLIQDRPEEFIFAVTIPLRPPLSVLDGNNNPVSEES